MTQGEPAQNPPQSPITRGRVLAERWTVGARTALRGDVHVHRGAGSEHPAVHIAVWRYRGTMPLPRFLRRLEAARDQWVDLHHGNLAVSLDGGRVTGETTCFWVQEDPGGTLLSARLQEHPRLAPEVALHIGLQVGHALRAAHGRGATHGDLDPINVGLLGSNDRVRLGWPALAPLLERAGLDAGRGTSRSAAEVAPEVLAGGELEPAADRYALGALLYRMLSGEPPFLVRSGGALPGLERGDDLPPLPDGTPAAVVELITDLLQRDPARRPFTTEEVVGALVEAEAMARGRPVPPGSWAPTPMATPPRTAAPSPVRETLSPAMRRGDDDPALTNVPRGATPTPTSVSPRTVAVRGGPDLRVFLLGGTVALLVVALFAVWGALWARSPDSVAVVAAPPPVPDVAPEPRPSHRPPPLPSEQPAVLTLRTDPPGATVWEGDQRLGATPLEILMEGGPETPSRVLVLRRRGYATHTVRQAWSDRDVQHTVPLQLLPTKDEPPGDLPEIREER